MEHRCNAIISEEFILKHISNDVNLLEKYNKFKKRAEIIKDENKKICPKPDCDSYLEKSSISKYVKCENGHEYCFECLNPPHGDKSCKPNQEKLFMKWKKDKKAKRCPKCQMYTEKNEGCNHMTCVNCHYQWYWLCEGDYNYNHYEYGKCRGQQFTSANDLEENENHRNVFGLHKIFFCFYPEIISPFDLDKPKWLKYISIILFLFFGYAAVYLFIVFNYLEKCQKIKRCYMGVLIYFIGFVLLICFQFTFTCLVFPFILIALIYHRFFDRILLFFGIGESHR